jgi:tetratricopeptide (TPR) repeat protein
MSLLLEALKKAEKAKEEAQRRTHEGGGELSLADDATAGASAKPVLTRPELPDITAPLEILSEDLAAKPAAGQLSMETPAPAPAQPPRRPAVDAQAADRATARKVFEAKVREPNPRLPFQLTVGALSVAAVGTIVYFWIQLSPPAPLVNTNPPPPAPSGAQAAPAPVTPAPAAQAQAAIPGLPSATLAGRPPDAPVKPAPQAAVPVAQARSATPAIPRDTPAPRIARVTRSAPVERAPEGPLLATSRPAPQVHPRVVSAYAAYQAGDLATARHDYQQALREEPANRDALLGLAAVETRAQRYELADAMYGRLLHADPRDAYAQAGLLALRGQGIDPQTAESRLKTLIAGDPEAGVLQFALGNLYARQQRWPEAQQVYFKAMATDPDNPDYAYNLAVSLEHVRQRGPALDYYRRALALAQQRNASFDAAAARERVQNLSR